MHRSMSNRELIASLEEAAKAHDQADRQATGDLMRLAVHRLAAVERLGAGATDVIYERARQIEQEGFGSDHDDAGGWTKLAQASASYLIANRNNPAGVPPPLWPWSVQWWKPGGLGDERRRFVKAAALAIAAVDAIDRATPAAPRPVPRIGARADG
jgi:hypothetical protein